MEGAAMEVPLPILELTIECETLYTKQIARLSDSGRLNGAALLSDFSHEFSVWATFLGVFAEPNVCLDRKLHHHVDIQEEVLQTINTVMENLSYVIEPEDPTEATHLQHPDEPEYRSVKVENLEAISEAIKRLNRTAVAPRKTSAARQIVKARQPGEPFDFVSFEGFAYLALKTMYAAADEKLVELLTRSMTETFALFLQSKSRHEKLQTLESRLRKHTTLQRSSEDSITVSRTYYPRPSKESMHCDWCFGSLSSDSFEGNKWQKHLHEDHKPYICLAEKCAKLPPRFASSRQWHEHMLAAHGPHWQRRAYPPPSWVCGFCNNEKTRFSTPTALARHLRNDSHRTTFTEADIKAVVRQFRRPSLRAENECPLCCHSIGAEQNVPPKAKSIENGKGSKSKTSRSDGNMDQSRKRTKTEAGHTVSCRHPRGNGHQAPVEQQRQLPKRLRTEAGYTALHELAHDNDQESQLKRQQQVSKDEADLQTTRQLPFDPMAGHIAGHLQTIMALTLRMISSMARSTAPRMIRVKASVRSINLDGAVVRTTNRHELPSRTTTLRQMQLKTMSRPEMAVWRICYRLENWSRQILSMIPSVWSLMSGNGGFVSDDDF